MYKKIIEEARKKGRAGESAMWKGIDDVDELLESIKEEHPQEYWKMIRKTHSNIYGPHYNESFAAHDIEKMNSTDKDGNHHYGMHWSREEVVNATTGKIFQPDTTDCDRWVAYNAAWHDFHKAFDDRQILDIAYLFFFADEDFPGNGKIWDYMCMLNTY